MIIDKSIYLVLDNIRSLLNVGAIFRTADAAGVKKIYLCGITAYPTNKLVKKIDGVEPKLIIADNEGNAVIEYEPSHQCVAEFLHKEIAKTALAALDKIEWEYKKNTVDAIKVLKDSKVNIIALEQDDRSIDYRKAEYDSPIAIIVGHERLGVSKEVLEQSDQIVELPMHGKGKSLNVATATGIILYKTIE